MSKIRFPKKNTHPLSADTEKYSGQPFRLKHSVSRKLHFCITITVFLSISLLTLVTFFLQPVLPLSSITTSQTLLYSLLPGLAVTCLASLGAFFLSKKITAPLTKLTEISSTINKGNHDTLADGTADDEIDLLTKTITSMSNQLKDLERNKTLQKQELNSLFHKNTKALQLRYARLEDILQTSSQGFWRVDNDLITQEINPRMAEILGAKQNDIIGKSIMNFVGIPNRTIFHKQIHLGKSLLSTEYEIELKQADSAYIPCLFNATPLLDENGEKRGSFVMVSDISTLKKTEKHLQDAIDIAEHASHVKSSFLASMSHEIRTPLNGIIGSLELLNNKLLDSNKQQQFMKTAQKSADFLLMLLNDILDLSKIEADKIELEKIPFLPRVLLQRLHSMFSTQCKRKGLNLNFTTSHSIPTILIGDETRLTQIYTNLLSNAIKFTAEGSIALSLDCDFNKDGYILLRTQIQDTGVGIAEDKQELIFNSFSQADTSTTREFGGTGLGLSLCQKLCALMGGKIWVTSVPGQGSSFCFDIPIQLGTTTQLSHYKKKYYIEPMPDAEVKPLDIMVVDDNNVNRDVAEMFLKQKGHRIQTASNGVMALQLLAMEHFDCIFMDVQMPQMDGVTATRVIRICEQHTLPKGDTYEKLLLKKLHAKIRNTHIPIIALTANVFQSDRQKYLEAGMDDHLGKPIRGKEMNQALLRATSHIDDNGSLKEQLENIPDFTPLPDRTELTVGVKLSDIKQFLVDTYSFTSEQINTLLATSATSVKETLDKLDQACLEENTVELGNSAHTLKGTLANLGQDQLAEKAKEIELAAKNKEKYPFKHWLKKLRQELEPLQKAL